MRVHKIMTLKECAKEKVETRFVERPEEPLIIRLNLDHEKMRLLDELYRLARRYPGKKPLRLRLSSKLQEVEIVSPVHVGAEFIEEAARLKEVDILQSA